MVRLGQGCPWCRDEVVWNDVCGFLDELKGRAGAAHDPDSLADLMGKWQEYEMTRSNSDVLLFARDMVQDVGMCAHIDRAIAGNAGWLRDSSGLWCRFHAMIVDGELTVDSVCAERIQRAVECAVTDFESNGGNAPQHGGAMYTQLAVALLCALNNGMSTTTLIVLCRRVGETCLRFWSGKQREFRERCLQEYAVAVSELVWAEQDQILETFFDGGRPQQAAGYNPDGDLAAAIAASLADQGGGAAAGDGVAAGGGAAGGAAAGGGERKEKCVVQ